eukprot:4652889-Pleurochrysis_carterae.AAC.2
MEYKLWERLRGRFPREHITSSANTAPYASNTDSGAGSIAWPVTDAALQASNMPIPLLNSVTGTNHPPGARRAAKAQMARREQARQMPDADKDSFKVHVGGLYFFELPDFEGKMRVGVGRPERNGEEEGAAVVSWLARRGWSNDPGSAGFSWAGALSFDAASGQSGRGMLQSVEPIDAVLPISVALTDSSSYDDRKPVNHRLQKVCLFKRCVDQLHAYCEAKSPNLLRSSAQARATAQQAAPALASAAPPAAAASSSTAAALTSRSVRQLQGASNMAPPTHKRRRNMPSSDSSDEEESLSDESSSSLERLRLRCRSQQPLSHPRLWQLLAALHARGSGSTALHRIVCTVSGCT